MSCLLLHEHSIFFMSGIKFKDKIIRFIEENKLLQRGQKLLVALSGGADSVALLRVLIDAGFHCQAAHCNFHLRGKESDRDEAFVRNLCETLGIKLHVVSFQTEEYAREHGVSIEMAARELRYEWFEKIRREESLDLIAVAHHLDDSVETFLLNLIRGTGIAGLCGIRPKNGLIVRPLLGVSREEILDYLSILKQDYVTDSTNLQDEYTRNKIRLTLLPMMREINPSVSDAISVTARRITEAYNIYKVGIGEALRRVCTDDNRISIERLNAEIAPKTILFELLKDKGFNSSQVDDIFNSLDAESGRVFLSQNYELLKDRTELILRKRQNICIPKLNVKTIEVDSQFTAPKDKAVCCIDADKLPSEDLYIRRWQSGDKFIPFGMRGYKSVRNYLRDIKMPLFDKENQCVVCSGNEIVWLVNERTDNRFRVTKDTRKVMVLTID